MEKLALSHFASSGCQVSLNGVKKGTAGTAILDTPGVTKFFVGHDIPLPFCTKGRVQLRRYIPKDHSRTPFQVFNFYLVSGPDYVQNTRIIKALLTVDCSLPTFVGGDMNFVEDFSDTTSAHPSLPTQKFGEAWDDFKSRFDLSDAPHGAHTFFRINKENPLSPYSVSSRLNRFLVLSSALSHPLFSPTVDVPHHSSNFSVTHVIGKRRSFSDHLPLRLAFSSGPPPAPSRPTIPVWLAESPACKKRPLCYDSTSFTVDCSLPTFREAT